MAQRRTKKGKLIVTFISTAYLSILENWLIFLANLEQQDAAAKSSAIGDEAGLLIFCLDLESYAKAQALGCEAFHIHQGDERALLLPDRTTDEKSGLGSFWITRMKVIGLLLSLNISVIQSDSDAIWTANPFPSLTKTMEDLDLDILSSKGKFPGQVAKAWGDTLCCGWIMYRASQSRLPLMLHLMTLVLQRMKTSRPDDQWALNVVLQDTFHMKWNTTAIGTAQHETVVDAFLLGKGQYCSSRGGSSSEEQHEFTCDTLRIGLLPYTMVTRRCKYPLSVLQEQNAVPLVMHCRAPKKAAKKTAIMEAMGLWKLVDVPPLKT